MFGPIAKIYFIFAYIISAKAYSPPNSSTKHASNNFILQV